MYEYMLNNKMATILAAFLFTLVAGALVGNTRIAFRSLVFNYGPSFACAFFVIGFFFDGYVSVFDLVAGFIFEFSVLLVFTKLYCDTFKYVLDVDDRAIEKWLRFSFVVQLLIALPILTSGDFGIFSEGSRIAYLYDSAIAKHLTFAGFLISAVQAGLIAQRLSGGHSLRIFGYAVIVVTFILSTLSGSKGGIFLWFASILALINYRHIQIRLKVIFAGIIIVVAGLVITVNVTSEILGISVAEAIELSSSRFFLNNDARALSFDMRGQTGHFSELLASSFRFLSVRFGYAPTDIPLGQLLHERLFGILTDNGANSSLIALITYYSMPGFALIPALIACLGTVLVYACVVGFRHMVHGPIRKMAVTILGLQLVYTLSQDFLAFPLLIPFACVAGFIFFITDRKYVHVHSR